ncbi:MAG: DUF202 domain-containing protein [Candidatus Latescibacteria bacterium]|nr:DUF202 domain-containing protein [Candidatus Latescibacterota bacterium]
MSESPYTRFQAEELILRDELAIDRTLLANERTLLAYLRSGVALLIAGASILHFSQESWFQLVGLACLPTGVVTTLIGAARYRSMHRAITHLRRRAQALPRGPGLPAAGDPANE